MKTLTKLSLAALVFAAQTAVAGPVAVIVNSANTQNVSKADVKSIYGDKTVAWADGSKIAVYNLPPEEDGAEVFAQKVLGDSATNAAAEEANRIVTNTSRNPQQAKRGALVTSIVSKTPNAIGYVPKESAEGKSGVKVLFTID